MAEKIPMGIGPLGFSNLIFKRKFRFTFELFNLCGGGSVPAHFVKVAARPSITIEETQIDFLNGRTWIPGKGSFETMSVTYYDVATTQAAPLFNWLASVYNFTDPINLNMGSRRSDYAGRALLKMWDGCGQLIEIWEMNDAFPTAINFGDVDYASSDIATIELTMRYSQVRYTPVCPTFGIKSCCTPCR